MHGHHRTELQFIIARLVTQHIETVQPFLVRRFPTLQKTFALLDSLSRLYQIFFPQETNIHEYGQTLVFQLKLFVEGLDLLDRERSHFEK